MMLTATSYSAAKGWLCELESGAWPRGRIVATKQAAVLRRIVSEYEEKNPWVPFFQGYCR